MSFKQWLDKIKNQQYNNEYITLDKAEILHQQYNLRYYFT